MALHLLPDAAKALQAYSHGFEISLEDGTRIYGGASSFDEARVKRIRAEHKAVRSGVRPLGSTEFEVKFAVFETAQKAA